MDEHFRTFCHISDYGSDGYANLHRLIATSSPLVLWAPSSQLLHDPRCRITPEAFVRYVERGAVRIIGRENWLLDKEFRDEHRWPGARWDHTVDAAIRSIALHDQSLPPSRRRVTIAPDEQGLTRATEHVEQHPEVIESLREALTTGANELPLGVVQHASRYLSDPRDLAINILRPAYNHLDAIAMSETRAPFFLSRKESRFHELLSTLQEPGPAAPPKHHDAEVLADLTVQVLDLMRHLDRLRESSLDGFVDGEGHELLTRWLSAVCEDVSRLPPDSVRGAVVRRLRDEFDRGRLRDGWRDIAGSLEGVVSGAGLTSAVTEVLVQQLGVFTAIGLATGAVTMAHGLMQKLGHAKVPYEGASQWPFLYAFGKPASGRRHAEVGRLLDGLT
ncbi:hypothetical protein Lesp02_65500 [Lentzea sp. NBRC 105346]|uniref:hypothetical protein n=1 Tax=Lentzea sp. NBRC 105346 TaxID=3032205 RepID=UPI0024A075B6|nr:hypothetical protein [Lentzea sp. NBRC 105346]GLZ34363.1 hypothetical protein Lesp02_65500 [Lentzea sp. NBRC 105346]